jgi:hypothetical protein
MEESKEKRVDESWKEKAKTEPIEDPSQNTENIPPADFKFFLTSLGMQAWIGLGMIPNPMTEKTEENLNQAKFIIDSLEMLQQKTKGNLDKEEAELFENLLYELRLAYVHKTMKTPTP